jgi:hypothetical protein
MDTPKEARAKRARQGQPCDKASVGVRRPENLALDNPDGRFIPCYDAFGSSAQRLYLGLYFTQKK